MTRLQIRNRWRAASRGRRLGVAALGAIALYATAGFLVLPAVLRSQAPPALEEALGRTVEIREVGFNPFTLTLNVDGLRIGGADDEDFVRLNRLVIDLEASSVYRGALILGEILLIAPDVHIGIGPDGQPSFADITDRFAAEPEAPEPESEDGAPFALLIERFELRQGRISFRDESRPTVFEEELAPIDFTLRNLTTVANQGESSAEDSLTIYTNSGAEISWNGSLSIAPLESSGEIRVKNFRSRTPWRYFRDALGFETMGGTVTLAAKYVLDAAGDALELEVTDGTFALEGVTVFDDVDPERPRLVLPRVALAGITMNLSEQRVEIAEISSTGTRLRPRRNAAGKFHALEVLAAREADDGETTEAPTDDPAAEPGEPAPPWSVKIGTINLNDWGVEYTDLSTPTKLVLDATPITLVVRDLSTVAGDELSIDLAATIVDGGTLRVAGSAKPFPVPTADLDVTLDAIGLSRFQPYVEASSGAVLKEGALSGKLAVEHLANDPDGVPRTRVDGAIEVVGLRVGTHAGRELVRAERIGIDGLRVAVEPLGIEIDAVEITQPETFVHLLSAGESNFADLARKEAATEVDAVASASVENQGEEASLSYHVGKIEIVDGTVRIRDENVDPVFRLGVRSLEATVENVSSDAAAATGVAVRAKVGPSGSLSVRGKARLGADPAEGEFAIDLKDFDTVSLSPYTGRYIARRIARGRLDLDLDYEVEQSKLESSNAIRIESLTLGKKVPSADAIDLPVDLAIVLLRDTKGAISLDVPVNGQLDDPSFRFGGVIAGTLRDLILKATTAPFALVGGLVAGADDLGIVKFARGRAGLGENAKGKLDALAAALAKKPGLRLDVPGIADPELDVVGLQEAALEDELKALRFAELRERSRAPATPAEIELDGDLRDRLVAELYAQRFDSSEKELRSEAPETDANGAKVDARKWAKLEMRRRLSSNTPVDENALETLASARAEAIVSYLVAAAGVPPERVAAVESSLRVTGEGRQPYVELILTAE